MLRQIVRWRIVMKAKFIVFRHLFKNIYSFVFSMFFMLFMFFMFFMFFMLLMVCCLFFSQEALAFTNDGPEPPHTTNGIKISLKITEHIFDYMHFHPIGTCIWWHCHWFDCGFDITPELDEYLPDLIVSAYNGRGNNPLYEMSQVPSQSFSLDDLGYKAGNLALNEKMPSDISMANGNSNTLMSKGHYDAMRTKSVDVIGSPLYLFHIPYLI